MAESLRVLRLIIVELTHRGDLDLRQHLKLLVSDDRHRDLRARHELLREQLVLIREDILDGLRQRRRLLHDLDADAGALARCLQHRRQPDLLDNQRRNLVHTHLTLMHRNILRGREPRRLQHILRVDLVHADSTRADARAGIRNPRKLQHTLNTAVLAALSMQREVRDLRFHREQLADVVMVQVEQRHICEAILLQRLKHRLPALKRNLPLRRNPTIYHHDLQILLHSFLSFRIVN